MVHSPPHSGNLERRSVVSGLLFPCQPYASKPYRVLLFRRSEKVSTYQKKLGAISGYVEKIDKTPLDAAWRELKEETGLGPQQVELWRRGPGFEFTDETAIRGKDGKGEKIGRIWKVWPFAFRLKKEIPHEDNNVDALGLHLDWEHLNCEWNNVDDLISGKILDDCVPRLEVTLGQVWVDPESVLNEGLEELRLDHSHGARELATMAVKSLVRIVEHDQQHHTTGTTTDVSGWWKSFVLQAFHLAHNGRPSMGAAISSAVVTALRDAKSIAATTGADNLDQVKQCLQSSLARRGDISKRVSDEFSSFLQERFKAEVQSIGRNHINILTLSSSSTIEAAILHALEADETLSIELRILESRPLFEGVSFAQKLTAEVHKRRGEQAEGSIYDRLRIILATDASVGILSKDIDLVIIGADRISEAGDVSNKIGSLPVVLTSKHVTNGSAVVVCISEADKIAPPGAAEEHAEEDNDKDEVTSDWKSWSSPLLGEMVTIRNVYFEWVPATHIDHYICEDGILSTKDIKDRSKRVSEFAAEVFSDLQS